MIIEPEFTFIKTNGITLRAVVQGEGPLVVLVHGFPESWHAWRHQIPALAALGFKVCAIDLRGYGGSDKPHPVEAYDLESMTGDLAGVIESLGSGEKSILIGHDWGAALVWNTALLRPDVVGAVAALSVPFLGIGDVAFIDMVKVLFTDKNRFFYQAYFQPEGVAEADLEADLDGFIRKFYFWISGKAAGMRLGLGKPADAKLTDGLIAPKPFPAWMSEDDIAYLVSEFEKSGLRGPINRYRNQHRDVAYMLPHKGQSIHQPALFIGGTEDLVLKFTPGIDPIEVMKAVVPNLSKAVLLEGCGHWTQQERPEAVTHHLGEWLTSLPSPL